MMKIETIEPFDKWLSSLRDKQGKARIIDRIKRVAAGNMGDCKPVGGSVLELRMAFGPGYRVYFIKEATPSSCCSAAVTSQHKAETSSGPTN